MKLLVVSMIFFAITAPCRAGEGTSPVASAAEQWFLSDPSLGCLNRQERKAVCGRDNEHSIAVYYGNADGGSGSQDAVVVATYLVNPLGNLQSSAVAYFHQDGSNYRFVKRLPDVEGLSVAPGSPVRFGAGRVTMTIVTFKPMDPHCCPSGRKQVSLQLR